MSANLSKNDVAWEAIFEEDNVLQNISENGCFYISSNRTNQKRETRLMTKFDHQFQLPKIFKNNKLSIQPVSRGVYIIGHFKSYFKIPEDKKLPEVQYVDFDLSYPIKTISPYNLSSESTVILCACLSEMLADILEEEVYFTVFGRMSTGKFSYEITNEKNSENNSKMTIDIENGPIQQ